MSLSFIYFMITNFFMKNIYLLLIVLAPLIFVRGCCCHKENCAYPKIQADNGCDCKMDPAYLANLLSATVNSGSGNQQEESHDPTVKFSNDSTEIDASFSNGQWIWFRVNGQVPGNYTLNGSENISVYNSSSNTEYYAIGGYISFSSVDVASKKLNGTFDNMILVSTAGDTVTVVSGTFNIDN